jgi:hypothetical protein
MSAPVSDATQLESEKGIGLSKVFFFGNPKDL